MTALDGSDVVVLADGDDQRVQSAAVRMRRYGIHPVLIGNGVPPALTSVHPDDLAASAEGDSVHAALLLAKRNTGWSVLAGTATTTAHVARAVLDLVGLHDDAPFLSSYMVLDVAQRRVVLADCAVVPEPTAQQLARIAMDAAAAFTGISGETPSIAFLSHSTCGSARTSSARLVRHATDLARSCRPDLWITSEVQVDAVVDANIGARKGIPQGAPRPNVWVFPSLDAGNIGYKLLVSFAGARAYGPFLTGSRIAVSDLSRGAEVAEIEMTARLLCQQRHTYRTQELERYGKSLNQSTVCSIVRRHTHPGWTSDTVC